MILWAPNEMELESTLCVCLPCNMPLDLTWYSTPTETIPLWSSYVCFRDFCTNFFMVFSLLATHTPHFISFHVICSYIRMRTKNSCYYIVAAVLCTCCKVYNVFMVQCTLQQGSPMCYRSTEQFSYITLHMCAFAYVIAIIFVQSHKQTKPSQLS